MVAMVCSCEENPITSNEGTFRENDRKNRNGDVDNRAYWLEFNTAANLGLDDVTFLLLFSLKMKSCYESHPLFLNYSE